MTTLNGILYPQDLCPSECRRNYKVIIRRWWPHHSGHRNKRTTIIKTIRGICVSILILLLLTVGYYLYIAKDSPNYSLDILIHSIRTL